MNRSTLERLADAFLATMDESTELRRKGQVAFPLELPAHELDDPDGFFVGDIWRTSAPTSKDDPALVALTHEGEQLRGVLATCQTWLAAADDTFVPKRESPTGDDMLLCTWRDVPLSPTSLAGYVGTLPDGVTDALLMLLERKVAGGLKQRARGRCVLANDLAGTQWQITDRDGASASFLTGSRIVDDDDPRIRIRAAIRHRTSYLEEAAASDLAPHRERTAEVETEKLWFAGIVHRVRAATPQPTLAERALGLAGYAGAIAGESSAALFSLSGLVGSPLQSGAAARAGLVGNPLQFGAAARGGVSTVEKDGMLVVSFVATLGEVTVEGQLVFRDKGLDVDMEACDAQHTSVSGVELIVRLADGEEHMGATDEDGLMTMSIAREFFGDQEPTISVRFGEAAQTLVEP